MHTKLSLKLVCLQVCKRNSFDLPKARKTAAMNSAREVSMPKEGPRVSAKDRSKRGRRDFLRDYLNSCLNSTRICIFDIAQLLFTLDAPQGYTVSKNGSISFYVGCPEGAYRV